MHSPGRLVVFFIAAASALAAPPLVEMTDIQLVAGEGPHCGFPVLAEWRDAYWLAYRKAEGHNGEGDLIVLRSTDGVAWQPARVVDLGYDDRNAQWLATPTRLLLYHALTLDKRGRGYQSHVSYTDDGATWSQPQPCLDPLAIHWKPFEHKGRYYANAHRKLEGADAGPQRLSRLMTSTDGLKWEEVSVVRRGNWESETSFLFDARDHLYALLRTKYSIPGSILESDPPYATWTERKTGTHFSGHGFRTFRGVTYLFSRHYGAQSRTSTMIYTVGEGANLTPYCQTPINPPKGDCGYAEAVELGDQMLIAFYSSHEGAAKIYTGRVPLKRAD
jgi:hypothetical protein